MKLLFAASEAVPFIKTGGLADVAGTLPVALARAGVDARVILPKYRDISPQWQARLTYLTHFYVNMGWRKQYCGILEAQHEGVTFYFVDNEFYFARDSIYGSGPEEGERFGFFCRAVLEAMRHLNFFPDVLHCNDWQTGMIPALLKIQYMHAPEYANIRTLYTIHNLKFQGVFDYAYMDDLLGLGMRYYTPEYLEYYGCISFMKGGIVFSDMVSTVSPSYAREIQTPYYGERMDGLLRLRSDKLTGILNGIDNGLFDPANDPCIAKPFSVDDMEGKAACKLDLQRTMGLEQREEAVIIGVVSRLTEQKGMDLIERVLDDILKRDVQIVVVGLGDNHYQELFSWAQWRYQGRLAARFELNEALAHKVYAGSDLFLMPSKFEPCGLSQMIALRYGTVPIVRETGGLRDSIAPYNKFADEGTGFSFANYNAHELLYTVERAVEYYHDRKLWQRLMRRGMLEDYSWDISAKKYLDLYERVLGHSAATPEPAPEPVSPAPTGDKPTKKQPGKPTEDKPGKKKPEKPTEDKPAKKQPGKKKGKKKP